MSEIKAGNGKGMFMPEVTVEMFRNAPLEAVEELMADGEVFDVDLKEELHREKEQAYYKGYEDGRKSVPEQLTDAEQRIFLAAMAKEEKVCKQVDDECRPHEDSLVKICHEITRKVKGALWT